MSPGGENVAFSMARILSRDHIWLHLAMKQHIPQVHFPDREFSTSDLVTVKSGTRANSAIMPQSKLEGN